MGVNHLEMSSLWVRGGEELGDIHLSEGGSELSQARLSLQPVCHTETQKQWRETNQRKPCLEGMYLLLNFVALFTVFLHVIYEFYIP